MTPQEIIDVLRAFMDGKTIQFCHASRSDLPWEDYASDSMESPGNFDEYVWRVKPEPQKIWVKLPSPGKFDFAMEKTDGYIEFREVT